MLTAIGLIIIIKQLPHALGYNKDAVFLSEKMNLKSIDDIFNSTKIELETLVKTYSNSIIWRRIEFKIIIENGKISEFSYENSDKIIQTIKWLN
jgi:MFS superfamily sulfate permease-like transporter